MAKPDQTAPGADTSTPAPVVITPARPPAAAPLPVAPAIPAARDRRGEAPEPHGVIVEGMINPRPKDFDPTNPAGAPRLNAVHDTAAQATAHEQLTELLRQDVSKLSPAERDDRDRRLHELHYQANGQAAPAR